jgi:hypothetical protein
MFELSWTAPTCLQEAYERLIPIQSRRLCDQKIPQNCDPAEASSSQSPELPNTTTRRAVA